MKKKILSIAVAFTTFAQIFSFNIAHADENAEKGLAILEKAGVISTADIENAAQNVTRAKFTYYTAKALGRFDINDKQYFRDLPVEHWANPHISSLVEMGVIDLSDNGLFNPDSPVTPEQAYKIMLVALGYEKSGDMAGYTLSANQAGIFVSCQSPDSLTLNEAAEIIYNAMNVGAPRFLASGEKLTDESLEETTLMKRHNLVETDGVVTAVYGASTVSDKEVLKENTAYIDGVLYNVDEDVSIKDMLGRHIEFVYKEDRAGDGTVLYAKALSDDEIKITSDLITDFNPESYQLRYYKNQDTTKTSSLTFPDGIKVIYNGKVYQGRLSSVMNEFLNGEKHGEIIYVKSSRKQTDLLIVKSLRTVVAKAYSDNDEVFFDYYSPVDNFEFKDYDIVTYLNTDGTKAVMPTAFIAVLDIAESEDKKMAEVIICDKQVKGTLTAMISSDNAELEIDGGIYEMTDTAWNKFGQTIKIGTSVTARFDSLGRIVYIETAKSSGMQSGYIMKSYVTDDDTGIKYIFKMLSNGGVSKLELADKVELDGEMYKLSDYKQFFLNFPNVTEISEQKITVEPQVIRYELSQDGKISKIDTTIVGKNEIADKTLKLVHDAEGSSSKSLIYVSGFKRFGMNYLYDSSYTDVFVLPSGVEDGKITISGNKVDVDDSMYSTSTTFQSITSHSLAIYDYDAENPNVEIIVSQQTPLVNEMNIYMFDGMTRVLDSENVAVSAINCIGASGEKTVLIDKSLEGTASKLKKGDIIIVDTDLQGKKAYNIERYFKGDTLDFDDGTNRNVSNPYWYRGTYNLYGDSFIITARQKVRNVTKGYAYDVKNDVLEVMYEMDGNVSERSNAKNVPVIIYDKNLPKNEIYKGTLSDIDTYKTTGNSDLVLTGYYSEAVKCIFVYK